MMHNYKELISGKGEWSDFFESIYDLLQCEDLSFDERLAVMKLIDSFTNGDFESYDLWVYDNLKDSNTTNQARARQALRELNGPIWGHDLARTRLYCYMNYSITEYAYLCTDMGWDDSYYIRVYGELVESDNVLRSECIDLEQYMEGRGRCGTYLYICYDVDHKKKYFKRCVWSNTQNAGGRLYYIMLRDKLSYEDAIAPYKKEHVSVDKETYENIVQKFENSISTNGIQQNEKVQKQGQCEQEEKKNIEEKESHTENNHEKVVVENEQKNTASKPITEKKKIKEVTDSKPVAEKKEIKEVADGKLVVEKRKIKEAAACTLGGILILLFFLISGLVSYMKKQLEPELAFIVAVMMLVDLLYLFRLCRMQRENTLYWICLVRYASFLLMIAGGFMILVGVIFMSLPLTIRWLAVMASAILLLILGLTMWKKTGEKIKLME